MRILVIGLALLTAGVALYIAVTRATGRAIDSSMRGLSQVAHEVVDSVKLDTERTNARSPILWRGDTIGRLVAVGRIQYGPRQTGRHCSTAAYSPATHRLISRTHSPRSTRQMTPDSRTSSGSSRCIRSTRLAAISDSCNSKRLTRGSPSWQPSALGSRLPYEQAGAPSSVSPATPPGCDVASPTHTAQI
jgi:hypothetical protein